MDIRQEKILQTARSLIGPANYHYQIRDDEVPGKLNCARFAQFIYKTIGIFLGPATVDQAADDGKEIDVPESADQLEYYNQLLTSLKAGDLIFFEGIKGHYNHKRFQGRRLYIGHMALYSGEGKSIHCFREKDSGPGEIKEEPLFKIMEKCGLIVMVKRIL